ncbi:hypothetical protein [Herbaspirillum autotrophicum]|uniref:hypothetical protein n=1 Tax=Herbaspirillum autotrophicum TaxID=180195 RepID=UPI0012EDD46F|nr:hypothetical protein [Herbaspirillum autotrophicum]
MKFIREGKLTNLALDILAIAGISAMIGSYFFIDTYWLKITFVIAGLLIGSISGYASKAQVWGLTPFEREAPWRKAKKTYTSTNEDIKK